ncbi:unnamed protein product [Heterobilharzia americana]|nr:unnamed protein product [Heterobilharzia americana]
MPLYPSLEHLKVTSLLESQGGMMPDFQPPSEEVPNPSAPSAPSHTDLFRAMGYEMNSFCYNNCGELVPSLPTKPDEFLKADNTDYRASSTAICTIPQSGPLSLFYPDPFDKVEIRSGIRLVTLCKNECGKVGIQLKDIEKGIFVSFVEGGSPASLAGVRFAMDLLKNSSPNNIQLAIRDRPFERVVTVHKDSTGSIGVEIRNGLIKAIVKDSSAARNGLLINHYIIEVNGKNVVGLKGKALTQIIDECSNGVKFTIIPKTFHDKLTKNLSTGQLRVQMDRSAPV